MKTIADRMKEYEQVTNYSLTNQAPIIGRIDGRAFHTLTKRLKCELPFDNRLSNMFVNSAIQLADQMQGCVLMYTQSDEVSFLIKTETNYPSYHDPWFSNRLQKMVSVITSIFTAAFNRQLEASEPLATFDCRIFSIPTVPEARNYFVWRQRDCIKNSITSAAYYDVANNTDMGRKAVHKALHGLNQEERMDFLKEKTGIDWDTHYPDKFKNGVLIYKDLVNVITQEGLMLRPKWVSKGCSDLFSTKEGLNFLLSLYYR